MVAASSGEMFGAVLELAQSQNHLKCLLHPALREIKGKSDNLYFPLWTSCMVLQVRDVHQSAFCRAKVHDATSNETKRQIDTLDTETATVHDRRLLHVMRMLDYMHMCEQKRLRFRLVWS